MEINKISVIVSVFNEEKALPSFKNDLVDALDSMKWDAEIIFVNDGSRDTSKQILDKFAKEDARIKVIHFSRNYGHEAAMLAGIDYAKGEVGICLDADGQHPPKLIEQMVESYLKGNHIVNMVRDSRADGGFVKKITSSIFYSLLNRVSGLNFQKNASDFFLISKSVMNVLRNEFRERARFLRGVIQIIGFQSSIINFDAPKREHGESKYSIYKLFLFSGNAVVSFSKAPLHLGLVIGVFLGFISLMIGIYSVIMWWVSDVPQGYTTLVVLITFLFAMLFLIIGIIGVYLGYVFDEVKKRPIYIIDEINSQD